MEGYPEQIVNFETRHELWNESYKLPLWHKKSKAIQQPHVAHAKKW